MSQDALDVSDAVELCSADVTIERVGPSSTNSSGLKVAGAVSTFKVRGLLVPVTEDQLLRLPEGQSTDTTKALYTTAQNLRAANQPGGARGDEIVEGSRRYEIQQVNRWTVGRYQEVLAMEVDR